ncbi:MAG TPA: diaminopimelate epimerase [Terriglobales bacterium]|nr:diaminopimelate epimerase [Terriglobales bacterium]
MARPSVPFTKATACGNDFLIIESVHIPPDPAEFTRRICDRHDGVGADGVEWIFPGTAGAEVEARLINADGSPAEVSGNGTRCVAAWWNSRKAPQQSLIKVLTGAGVKECRAISHSAGLYKFEMNLGSAEVLGEIAIPLGRGEVSGWKIWMGNPQFVVFVDDFKFHWQARGAEIQAQKNIFPEGTNVDFVRITGPNAVECRFFERGAGETMSSGTGTCASAIAAMVAHGVGMPVTVTSRGGAQEVLWSGGSVQLTGPARLVCDGEFFI